MSEDGDRPLAKTTKIPLTDGLFAAIGRVTAEWTWAENVLEHFVWVLVPTDQKTGRAIMTHISNEQRCHIITTLSKELSLDLQSDAAALVRRFNDLRVERNHVVHNIWSGEASELARGSKISARGMLLWTLNYWSESDIFALQQDISEWIVDTVNFLNQKLWWPGSDRTFFGVCLSAAEARNQQSPPKSEAPPASHKLSDG